MKISISKLLSVVQYVPKRAAFLSLLALGVIVPAATFAWGPDRTTYTTAHPADHVVFNSITDNPVQGDERNFMQVRVATASNSTYTDSISLKADTEYVVSIYYHNNAASNLNASGKGVAKGAYVKAEFPTIVKNGQKDVNANGYVGAANASPKEVFDDINFSNATGSDLNLTYVKGSATIHNKGKTDGKTLPDSIATTGTALGFDSLNGVVNGCNDFAGYVTLVVKTSKPAAPSFTVKKDVRIKGTTTWANSVDAKEGDTVQYMVTYKNTGSSDAKDVVLKDTLPGSQTYVAGTSMIKNGNYPSGKSVSDNIVTANGINIGDYAPSGVGYVMFDAKIKPLQCGYNYSTNVVKATSGNVTQTATALVKVNKPCETPTTPTTPSTPSTPTPPETPSTPATPQTPATPTTPPAEMQPVVATTPDTPLPSTGPTEIVGGIVGTSSLGLGVHHFLASRRALRKVRP